MRVSKEYLETADGSLTRTRSAALGLDVQTPPCLTQKEQPQARAGISLLQKIAVREGIGDVLAHGVSGAAAIIGNGGVSGAAAIIGNGAEKFDHNTVKKFEQLPIKLGKLNPAYFLLIATGEDMAITQIEGSFPQDPITDPELKEEFIKKWVAVPDKKFHDWFRQWVKRDQLPDDAMVEICDWNECMHYLDDSLGLCGFVSSFRGQFGGTTGYHVWNMPQIITHTTGIEWLQKMLASHHD